ncbi:MAG: hypothetical protein HFG57_09565 [Lachnospiraceae bacterium]|nr:hypothetical protein [Lachnospiraceae bacterium]
MKRKVERKGGSSSGLFLMEMIVVVFFFVVCASQCILAFATSEKMSRQGRDLNQAVTMAESIAEVWKAEGVDGLTKRLGFSQENSGELEGGLVYFAKLDEQWQPAGENVGEDVRMARVEIREEGEISEAVVVMENPTGSPEIVYRGEAAELLPDSGGKVVFLLTVKKYERSQK